jgi:hypothetical protein
MECGSILSPVSGTLLGSIKAIGATKNDFDLGVNMVSKNKEFTEFRQRWRWHCDNRSNNGSQRGYAGNDRRGIQRKPRHEVAARWPRRPDRCPARLPEIQLDALLESINAATHKMPRPGRSTWSWRLVGDEVGCISVGPTGHEPMFLPASRRDERASRRTPPRPAPRQRLPAPPRVRIGSAGSRHRRRQSILNRCRQWQFSVDLAVEGWKQTQKSLDSPGCRCDHRAATTGLTAAQWSESRVKFRTAETGQ